jgi:hypothetical protein
VNPSPPRKPLFKRGALVVLAALAAGVIALAGSLFPPVKPVTDVVAPIVQDAIENAPASDDPTPVEAPVVEALPAAPVD